ncbi:hypothetical protein B296_00011589 [Ensete ventricosum]|uniref:Uncharacterized protein n=1 Tax=Ensete ventricosum TaxID=4639 RepID=A0A426XQY5_ENSVE|nr:hypothetical protein B296_00011589 [Ensete ventricosum]
MGSARAQLALNTIPFTISGKGLENLTNTRVKKDMSNKVAYIESTYGTMKYSCAIMK